MDALLEVSMNHTGTNLFGYPVPGVIDSVSANEQVVVEYSDRTDYFAGDMKKAEGDLNKALRKKPRANTIFLLSGVQRRPQKADAFLEVVMSWPQMQGKTLHLWGNEEIAANIIDHLMVNDEVVRRLSHYLPDIQRIWEEEAASALTPAPDPASLSRTDVDCELSRRLACMRVVAIAGMAGLGKSHAAAAFAKNHSADYDINRADK